MGKTLGVAEAGMPVTEMTAWSHTELPSYSAPSPGIAALLSASADDFGDLTSQVETACAKIDALGQALEDTTTKLNEVIASLREANII